VRALERLRVLVADDNEMYGAMLARFVASHPELKVVGSVRDGGEAIAMASLLQPDVVLMDVFMPGMSGVEATRALAAMNTPAKVIALTAHRAPDTEELCLGAGASAFLLKADVDLKLLDVICGLAVPTAGAEPTVATEGREDANQRDGPGD
jgi:DNA-binding NarL/FixJ family response regulator